MQRQRQSETAGTRKGKARERVGAWCGAWCGGAGREKRKGRGNEEKRERERRGRFGPDSGPGRVQAVYRAVLRVVGVDHDACHRSYPPAPPKPIGDATRRGTGEVSKGWGVSNANWGRC